MRKNIHLLFGVGEVGSALKKILIESTDLYWFDINPKIKNNLPDNLEKVDVLHISFPQTATFIEDVQNLIKKYSPSLIIIHSTTYQGTTKKFGALTVHSPILGQHNNLYKHIKTFKKAIGPNSEEAKRLTKKFLGKIFNLEFYSNAETTETAKILSLTKFAQAIEFARYSQEFCKKAGVNYDEAYTRFSKLYNIGYELNKLKHFVQPILNPPSGKIGGSCVISGVKKAEKVLKSEAINEILKKNK
jgi:hypothetical protein